MACSTTGPMVMLGTNRPSITSTWIQSAPAVSTELISSPNRAKSADRIEGAIMIDGVRLRGLTRSASSMEAVPDLIAHAPLSDGAPALRRRLLDRRTNTVHQPAEPVLPVLDYRPRGSRRRFPPFLHPPPEMRR